MAAPVQVGDWIVDDGDTITHAATGERLRLDRINAPEVAHPGVPAAQQGGDTATAALARMLRQDGGVGSLRRSGTDPYGRTLAAPETARGTDIQAGMLRGLYAAPTRPGDPDAMMGQAKFYARPEDPQVRALNAVQAPAIPSYPLETARPAKGLFGALAEGAARGTEQLKAGIGGLTTVAGQLLDKPGLEQAGQQMVRRSTALAGAHPAAVGSTENIRGVGDAATWALEKVGEQVPVWGGILGGAAAGGLVGGVPGAIAGGSLAAGAMNTGESAAVLTERGVRAPVEALKTGVIKTALDVAPELITLASAGTLAPVATAAAQTLRQGLLRGVKTGAVAAMGEAPTEGAQEYADIQMLEKVDPTFRPSTAEKIAQVREAALTGGVVGGIHGTGTGLLTEGYRQLQRKPTPTTPTTPTTLAAAAAAASAPPPIDPGIKAALDAYSLPQLKGMLSDPDLPLVDEARAYIQYRLGGGAPTTPRAEKVAEIQRQIQSAAIPQQTTQQTPVAPEIPLTGVNAATPGEAVAGLEVVGGPVDPYGFRAMGAGMAKAMSDNGYAAILAALQQGKDRVAGVKDPLLLAANPAFRAGRIQSVEGLRAFAENVYFRGRGSATESAATPATPQETIVKSIASPTPVAPRSEPAPAIPPASIESAALRGSQDVGSAQQTPITDPAAPLHRVVNQPSQAQQSESTFAQMLRSPRVGTFSPADIAAEAAVQGGLFQSGTLYERGATDPDTSEATPGTLTESNQPTFRRWVGHDGKPVAGNQPGPKALYQPDATGAPNMSTLQKLAAFTHFGHEPYRGTISKLTTVGPDTIEVKDGANTTTYQIRQDEAGYYVAPVSGTPRRDDFDTLRFRLRRVSEDGRYGIQAEGLGPSFGGSPDLISDDLAARDVRKALERGSVVHPSDPQIQEIGGERLHGPTLTTLGRKLTGIEGTDARSTRTAFLAGLGRTINDLGLENTAGLEIRPDLTLDRSGRTWASVSRERPISSADHVRATSLLEDLGNDEAAVQRVRAEQETSIRNAGTMLLKSTDRTVRREAHVAEGDAKAVLRTLDHIYDSQGRVDEVGLQDLYQSILQTGDDKLAQQFADAAREAGAPVVDPREAQEELTAQTKDSDTPETMAFETPEQRAQQDFLLAKTGESLRRPTKDQTPAALPTPAVRRIAKSTSIPDRVVDFANALVDQLGLRTSVALVDEDGLEHVRGFWYEQLGAEKEKLRRVRESAKQKEVPKYAIDKQERVVKAYAQRLRALDTAIAHTKSPANGGSPPTGSFIRLTQWDPDLNHQLIFLRKDLDDARRVRVLTHELGHYLQRNVVDQLVDQTRAFVRDGASRDEIQAHDAKVRLLEDIFGLQPGQRLWELSQEQAQLAEERFAEMLWNATNELQQPKSLLQQFFTDLAKQLRKLYTAARDWLQKNSSPEGREFKSFKAFVETLIGRAQGIEPKTTLGRQYDRALRDVVMYRQPPKGGAGISDFPVNQMQLATAIGKLRENIQPAIDTLDGMSVLYRSVDSQLRAMGGWVENWMAPRFAFNPREQGRIGVSTVYHLQQQRMGVVTGYKDPKTGKRVGGLHFAEVLRSMPKTSGWLWKNPAGDEQMRQIQDYLLKEAPLPADVDPVVRTAVLRIRTYFKRMHKQLNRWGMQFPARKNYFPRYYDMTAWRKRPEEVKQILRETTDWDADAIDQYYLLMTVTDGGIQSFNDLGVEGGLMRHIVAPQFANWRPRSDNLPKEATDRLAEAGFYQRNIAHAMNRYVHQAVKRSAYETVFGGPVPVAVEKTDAEGKKHTEIVERFDPLGKLQVGLVQARVRNEIDDLQYWRIQNVLLPALMGRLGSQALSPQLRAVQNYVLAGFNVALLPLATLSSLVELGQIDVRAGKLGTGFRAWMRSFKDTEDNAKLKTLAHLIGTIRDDLTESVLSQAEASEYTLPGVHKFNEQFFRATGLHLWTKTIRTAAFSVARDALLDYARTGNTRAMEELRVTAAQIRTWAEDPNWHTNVADHPEVMQALNEWVDQAVLRPNASMRPAWGSDHRMQLIWYLKDFMWAYWEKVAKRVIALSREGRNIPAKALPYLMLGAAMIPLAAAGYELRWLLTQQLASGLTGVPVQTPHKEGWDYFQEVTNRSGILGPLALIYDMWQATEHNDVAFAPLLGAPMDTMLDWMTKDWGYVMQHRLPGAAQSSVVRKWMFN